MKESELVKRISDYLKTVPSLFFWKEHGGMYGTVGKNKPTVLQAVTIRQIIAAGGYAVVVRTVEEVREIIQAFEKE